MRRKNTENLTAVTPPQESIGLTAADVEIQKKLGNDNTIKENSGKSYLQIIISNVFTFFNMLMICVAICELIFCGFNMITNMSFLLLIISNTLIGTIQECHSKRVLDKLKLLENSKNIVVRDREEVAIPPTEIVKFDIVKLSIGDQIPADLRILKLDDCEYMEVNESLLTGESHAVKKGINQTLLAGSYVITGACYAIAEKVGPNTYLHSIEMKAKDFKKPESRLLISINRIIKILACVAVPLSLLVFWNNLVTASQSGTSTGVYFIWDSFGKPSDFMDNSLLNLPMKWAGMTITYMIPAGMILLSSVAMATGVVNLANKKALTRDIYSVEALSRVDTLCLDKTGTITDGTMRVIETIQLSPEYDIDAIRQVTSTYLSAFKNENQTSKAMHNEFGIFMADNIQDKIEFSSDRKFSVVSMEHHGTFALGAPEYLTSNTDILNKAKDYADKGLRVIIMVRCNGAIKDGVLQKPQKNLPIAMYVIQDHIRPEVRGTLKWFRENDVDVRIISGDNVNTVSYIAKVAGVEGYDRTFDMSTLTEKDDINEIVMNTVIFGRVSPEQKAMIVDILKKNGRTVSMTGDGINDIVALKKADCSIALANGAPATKNIANIVLMDSNFDNMKNAVLEGRRVVNNIQRSSTLFVMKDFLWFFITLLPLLFGLKPVIESTVMTMVNTMITGFASTLLAFEPDKSRIQGNFLKNVLSKAIISGFFMFLPIAASYIYAFATKGLAIDPEYGFEAVRLVHDMMPVMSICVTIAGFVIFAVICMPFTKYRKILYFSILALVVILLLAMPECFLVNGTEFLNALRMRHGGNIWDMLCEIVFGYTDSAGISYGGLFSMRLFRNEILPNRERWIFILVFIAICTPLYIFTNKYLTKFLNKTMFNPNKFMDEKEKIDN